MLNISGQLPIDPPGKTTRRSGRECSKKFVQQGRSHFDERSVLSVREHGKMPTMPGKPFRQSQGTPLAAFSNIPLIVKHKIRLTGVPKPHIS